MRHPGVVRVVARGVAAGLPWYAMELLGRRSLADLRAELGQEKSSIAARFQEMKFAAPILPPQPVVERQRVADIGLKYPSGYVATAEPLQVIKHLARV